MIPKYYNIWHHHKDWSPGIWARLIKGAKAKPLLPQFGCPYAYYPANCFELSSNNKTHRDEFNKWLDIHMLELYIPRDWVLRNDECRYIWCEVDYDYDYSYLSTECSYVPIGIFNERPDPKDFEHRRWYRVYQNYRTKQWDIVEEG